MCKVNFVKISEIFDDQGDSIGKQYIDSWMVISNYHSVEEAFNSFRNAVNDVVTDDQSIIMCRDDVRKFASAIANSKANTERVSSTEIFSMLKSFLKDCYDVKRIKLNPRTLEYRGLNKSFLIHKFTY